MSALGHKQTFAVQKVMSALPPIADMCGATSPCPLCANSGHRTRFPIASSGCDPSQSHKPMFLIAVGRLWDLWLLQYAATFAEFFCRRS